MWVEGSDGACTFQVDGEWQNNNNKHHIAYSILQENNEAITV